uniref:Nipped-B protein n=1 Tax=Ciona savignyi TaxID=51511 RepID=H2ZDM6_CIOSA
RRLHNATNNLFPVDGAGLFRRLSQTIERIFDDMDTVDPRLLAESAEDDDMQEVHPRLLISKSRLQDLSMETAKLKAMGLLCQLPKKTLVRLLSILEPNIRNGVHATPCKSIGNTAEEQRWNRDNQLGRVATATDAALTAMNIMTAPYMPKAVYLDDVMERSAQLLCRQLANTIFPEYDLVYKVPSSTKKKGVKGKNRWLMNHMILQLYNKLNVMVNQWVELVRLQPLTDTTILQISSVGVSPFFVENVRELQLSSIKLTTALFSKYDKHRALILEDIFQSLARLPTSKQNLRNYRYPTPRKQNTGLQYVQMVSALMLQMIQAIVHLPEPYQGELSEEQTAKEESTQKQVDELQVINSYDCAVRTGQNFLSVFLKKCASKSDETDYRPLFENFIHDLLATVNKPEWPASEMLLSVLGRLLVHTFSTKSTEMSLRVASLDYLGVVAAKLRRDAVTSNTDVATVRNLLKRLEELSTNAIKLIERLECLLLAYLRRHSPADPSLMLIAILYSRLILFYFVCSGSPSCLKLQHSHSTVQFAHNFYIGQWLRDASVEFQQVQQQENVDIDTQTIAAQTCQAKKGSVLNLMTTSAVAAALLSQLIKLSAKNVHKRDSEMAAGLTVEDAMLLSRHLASTRQFSRAFDCYLSYILRVREESAVALRTRAIKCLAEVVAVDPSIMSRTDIAKGVRQSLVDSSTSVREAAIDLVGRFILLKPELVPHYYDMLSARIMDTGVSVRKRVIRILRDLCHEHPQLPQLTDACVKMIRRVNDEDGIKKLVHEVFMKMWFTPVHSHDAGLLRNKALLITDIVAANRDHGYEWIEQLFKNLIDTSVPNPQVELACKQIVDCLVQHVILFEQDKPSGKPKTKERSVRLVATVQTLVQLARIRPRLLVNHVMTLQPYLATKCETPDDLQTVHGVCRVLELAVPLMEHPSEAFLATVEEDMMRMILTHRLHVVSAAIASLGAITCYVTNNYKLIWDCFQKMCNYLSNARITHEKNPSALFQTKHFKQLLRALYIIGHFSKTFDFDNEKLKGKATICVKEKVYDCIYYFTRLDRGNPDAEELCTFAMRSLGLLMIQDPNMMFLPTTRDLYKSLLSPSQSSDKLKKQVLLNLQTYLQTEDVKMQAATEASIKKAKHSASAEQSIKEIKDVSSGMASSVMQLFLKEVLESFFHHHSILRHAALHTIYLTLQQGLVHPVQCVPYLIAAASDTDPVMHKEASQQLTELNKRYVGFVHTKALQGLRLAFQLQTYIQPRSEVIRGYYEATIPSLDDTMGAKCSHLYQMVRSDRKHRRALLISILNLFDDTVKTDLEMLLFLADNLAHFPYHTLDEPLFLISQVEVYVSVSGSNVLQSFKEQKSMKKSSKHRRSSDEGSAGESSSDDDESETEEDTLRHRLPDKDAAIEDFAQASLACLLLLWVKQHLKTAFGLKDSKIHQYSTTEVNKANDKQCHRKKSDIKFQPTQVVDHIK